MNFWKKTIAEKQPQATGPYVSRVLRRVPIVILVFCLGVTLSLALFFTARHWEDKNIKAEFEHVAGNHVSAFERIVEQNLHELEAVHSLFLSSYVVERNEFQRFTQHLLSSNPGIQALEWIQRVPDELRKLQVEIARNQGFPEFRITERDDQSRIITAKRRSEYFPIYYVEPYEGNEIALGFDLASDPARLAALRKAWHSREVTSTGRIRLVQETGEQFGFLIFRPVYQDHAWYDGINDRRKYLQGFVAGVFRISDLLGASLAHVEEGAINIHIYDESASREERFLYFHSGQTQDLSELPAPDPGKLRTGLHFAAPLEMAGRQWLFLCTPTPDFLWQRKTWQPWGILMGGLLFTTLLSSYIRLIQSRVAHTRKYAARLLRAKKGLEREIVERERAEKTLKESEERFSLERKRLEQERAKAEKLESLGLLAGGLAHDFNNLLTAILGNISLAKTYLKPDNKIYKPLSESERAAMRATNLTQQLLTFSKGGTPVRKTISLGGLIEEAASFALRGSNVKSEKIVPPDLWCVNVDEGQMSQVIHNLIINADQAMPQGGTIRITCENVRLSREPLISLDPGHYVRISIQDRGMGIVPENQQRIFDPYFTTKEDGNGLGLATCYSIVKKHLGHITVASKPGEGTTFQIYLKASEEQAQPQEHLEYQPFEGHGKILLMDDEEMVRDTAGAMLKNLGYDVRMAEDGEKAIKLFQEAKESEQPFDVVIMDLTVPGGMGGKEALPELLHIDPEVRAIVSSGYSSDHLLSSYSDYGFCNVLAKPYKMRELGSVLSRTIRSDSAG